MDVSAKILSFLELGYFLDYQKETVRLPERIKPIDQTGVTREDLFITLRQKMLKSIEEGYSPGQICVVPLSGGLDSRAVLGGVLPFAGASDIITYTFGIPGSFDYEIAPRVAKQAGVHNIRIPLDKYEFTLDELIETSRSMDHQTLLFYHAPLQTLNREFSNGVHWSGFLGEAVSGDHIRGPAATSMTEAEEKFFAFNRFVKGTDAGLVTGGREFNRRNLYHPDPAQGFLTYEEGLDLLNRQNKYIAPHVMLKGFEHQAPFNHPGVIGFFLGLTEAQKREQVFFKEFLQWWRPWLYEIPVKNNAGFPLNVAPWRPKLRRKMFGLRKRLGKWQNPNINYFDFSERIVYDEKFKSLVMSQLEELKSRKILPEKISPKKLWREHQLRVIDHGLIIQALTSLEIHLKAGKIL